MDALMLWRRRKEKNSQFCSWEAEVYDVSRVLCILKETNVGQEKD